MPIIKIFISKICDGMRKTKRSPITSPSAQVTFLLSLPKLESQEKFKGMLGIEKWMRDPLLCLGGREMKNKSLSFVWMREK